MTSGTDQRSSEHDVIVVGAGPAGSTAARELATRGRDVLMLDRARFPRVKPCGGVVSLRSASLLPFDLSPVIEHVVSGAYVRLGDGAQVERTTAGPLAYMTQRSRLDHFLAERAQEAGAQFRDGSGGLVRSVQQRGGEYEVAVNGAVHRARVLIGADGANGVVGNKLGFEHARESAVALEANVPCPGGVPPWLEGRVALQLGRVAGGYGWVFPKGDHLNVGAGGWKTVVGGELRASLDRLCRTYEIDPATLTNLRGHHLPMMRPGAPLWAGGALLIGDAAGLVDPLSGEGIYAAMASGIAAAPAVDDYLSGLTDSPAGYQRTVERELLPDIVASHALTEILHAWPRPFVTLIQRSERFWAAMAETLTGERTIDALVRRAGPAASLLASLARRVTARRYGER
ncbi:MAG: geranylgeranyl reductase family protein [Dehalococcoidia bacterium]|jgi:geranylgeranyl reductase family protein|nr:geranylgeranyl reductase family protein [Dehalococcoidia bacterium]